MKGLVIRKYKKLSRKTLLELEKDILEKCTANVPPLLILEISIFSIAYVNERSFSFTSTGKLREKRKNFSWRKKILL